MVMKTGQILINPARAIVLAALLAFPMYSLAQFNASSFGGGAQRPVCEYKRVMSDAEIEVCTGFRVRYGYDVYSGGAAAGEGRVAVMGRKPAQARRGNPRKR